MTWQLANGLGSGSVISVNFLKVPVAEADIRFGAQSGLKSDIARGPKSADIVAKVFLGWRTKILRAADAFSARRREGPCRFIQNRSRTSIVALKSDAAAEKSKDQLWQDFRGFSIFDFCNNICQQQTKKAATFDAVWRFGGHHTHPYVSGSDVKNVL
jgi:hypothetical protein